MRVSTRLVATLLFGSGLAALVYQTAWQRMLQLVFGASTAASAAVLGIFLGGLGLGGAWLGARAERHPKPLYFYGNLELGVALSAAVTPLLVELAARLYFWVGGSAALGWLGATLLRLLLATLVMGPAVVLMGGTLPAAARAVEVTDDAARGRLAVLYAVNTGGAVVGSLLGTFVLFELFGTRLALWGACLVNALVAIIARGIGRDAEAVPVREGVDSDQKPASGETAKALRPALVYGAAGIVGFAFLYLELIWYRMLSPLLGGSSFTFGLVLAVTLAGIGVGGYVYSRRDERRPATLSLLALTISLEALAVGIPLALGDRLAIYAAYTRDLASLGFTALVVSWVLVTAFVVFPAALVSGYQFPVLFALLGRGRAGVARQVGLTYAFNTVGSILGAILGGLVLMPRIGAVTSWRSVVVLLAVTGVGFAALAARREGRLRAPRVALAGFVALLGIACMLAEGPTAAWRHRPIGVGRVNISDFDPNRLEAWRRAAADDLVWERDGIESAVALADNDGYAFLVNGKSDGAVILDRGTQGMAALLPVLLHDEPRSVFVLGLGTGMTAGWVARVPSIEHVDVAELEPSVVEVARASSAANLGVLDRPNVKLFLGDGREFILTTNQQYDVVTSEPSNPYRAGIASLLTLEFYQGVKRRLKPRGIFAQWVQMYEIDALTIRIVLRTVREAFPHVEAWQTQWGDLLLIASLEPLAHDVDRLRRRILEEPYRTALPRLWLVQDAEGVLSHFVANGEFIAQAADPVRTPLNTDDHNVLEYAFARHVENAKYDAMLDLALLAGASGRNRPVVRGNVDWDRVAEQWPRSWNISRESGKNAPLAEGPGRRRARAVEAGCFGQVDEILGSWTAQPRAEPIDAVETLALALGLARAKDEERARELAKRLEQQGFVAEAALVLVRLHAEKNEPALAVQAALRALGELRREPFPLCSTAVQLIGLLEHVAASDPALAKTAALALSEAPLAVHSAHTYRQKVAFRLAFLSGESELCVQALGSSLERPIWEAQFLATRLICLERARHSLVPGARADFQAFLGATPSHFGDALNEPTSPEKLAEKLVASPQPASSAERERR